MGKKTDHTEILTKINDNASSWYEYYSVNNRLFREEKSFVYGEDAQWTSEEVTEYKSEGKPRLTFNLIRRYLSNLMGEYSENTPDTKVYAENPNEVPQEKVDIVDGILRTISLSSRANRVYRQALDNALSGGYGAFMINVKRSSPKSFSFEPTIDGIEDPTMCFWDPSAKDIDKADGDFCGRCFTMSKKEFENKYPKVTVPASGDFLANASSSDFRWVSSTEVTIVDYYEKEYYREKYAQLSNGQIMPLKDAESYKRKANRKLSAMAKVYPDKVMPPKLKIEKEEMLDLYDIHFYRVVKDEVLENKKWDGKYLPLIFWAGILQHIDGRERTISFVNSLKDAQRAYNYARSEFLYRIKLTRYEPYLVTAEMVKGQESEWQNAHKAKAALIYNDPGNGRMPVRQSPQEIPQSLIQEMNQSLSDIQNIPGRFDANMGAPDNAVSGVAIGRRQTAGNFTAKPYFDNGRQAIETGAKANLDLVQAIMDTERNIGIVTGDGQEKNVFINDIDKPETILAGGDMGVRVTVGSSFELQKQESLATYIQMTKAFPALSEVTLDLAVENLNLPNAAKLVKRVKTYIMPQISFDETQDPEIGKKLKQKQQEEAQKQQLALSMEAAKLRNDTTRAHSSQMTGYANLIKAEDGHEKDQNETLLEVKKLEAEQDRTDAEILKAGLDRARQLRQNESSDI